MKNKKSTLTGKNQSEKEDDDEEDFRLFAMQNLARAYDEDEPDLFDVKLLEINPNYKDIAYKLTEDEIVNILVEYLKQKGWTIDSYCLGQKHGKDIVALKSDCTLIIEVKGARAGDNSPTKKREYFDSGQIKTHFGRALIKILDEKHLNPKAKFAIAHPDDILIRKSIGHLVPFLKKLDIKHYWVSVQGNVIEE